MNTTESLSVTVTLCTCNRPAMLRDALESIRGQTARSAVARIIVSENSLNDESEAVCREFSDLPIKYVKQRPPVPILEHLGAIWHLVESPLVAILHDDDWWAPGHLESAIEVLQSNERCAATYSSFLESYRPQSYGWFNQCYFLSWFALGCDFSRSASLLDPTDVMLSCLLNAGLHYSTVVGRKEAMWDAYSRVFDTGNAFDNDRTFPVFLSRHGSIGYLTAPEVFVRLHPSRDAFRPDYLNCGHMVLAQKMTRWLLKNYPEQAALAAARFNELASRVPSHEAGCVLGWIEGCAYEPQRSTLIRECGLDFDALAARVPRPASAPSLPQRILPKWAFNGIKAVCPPIVWNCARRLRDCLGGRWYIKAMKAVCPPILWDYTRQLRSRCGGGWQKKWIQQWQAEETASAKN
jgi:hypothetical protein